MMHIINTADADSCTCPGIFTDKNLLFTDGQHLYAALLLSTEAGDMSGPVWQYVLLDAFHKTGPFQYFLCE